MIFDPLSFVIGKHGDSGPVRDVVSYLMGRSVGTAGEIWQTITNVAVATFTTVSSALRALVVDVTPVQSGSGDPAPDNVRPISGWTGANVHVNGANLVDGISYISGYYIAADGTVTAYADAQITDYLPVVPGIGIIWTTGSTATVGGGYRLHGYDKNKQWVSQIVNETKTTTSALYLSAVIPSNVAYIRLSMPGGASTSAMECYNGTTYPVSWQTETGTVYGGTLTDNDDGMWTLTVTHAGVDLGTLSLTYNSSYSVFLATIMGIPAYGDGVVPDFLCSCYVPTSAVGSSGWGSKPNNTIGVQRNTANNLRIKDARYTDGGDLATALTGQTLVYALNTPQTYTLTTDSVQALIGQNNIFADTGNINTITFRTQ